MCERVCWIFGEILDFHKMHKMRKNANCVFEFSDLSECDLDIPSGFKWQSIRPDFAEMTIASLRQLQNLHEW